MIIKEWRLLRGRGGLFAKAQGRQYLVKKKKPGCLHVISVSTDGARWIEVGRAPALHMALQMAERIARAGYI